MKKHWLYFAATILSQGSSNTSAPFKATVVTSSFDSGSPSGRRLSSGQRISAKDGTRILEKFKKATQDDLSPTGNCTISLKQLSILTDTVVSNISKC